MQMNYEELYLILTAQERDLRDSIKSADKYVKQSIKNTESGNLAEMKKAVQQLAEASQRLQEQSARLGESLSNFDTKEYFVSGDFTRQLLEACEKAGIDVKGEKGVYEMFPYKIRIIGDEEHPEEVWMNRKKLPSYRPAFVAATVKEGQQKLYRANFNEESFMSELAEAYDMTCLKSGARIGSSQTLTKIYKTLTPMARSRKEYDMQAFAFDLARLYEKWPESWTTKGGRTFVFGTSREGKNAIRVLSSAGVETFITTIKPLNDGTEEE